MPFSASDATGYTKKATTAKLRRQWASVANSTRLKCMDDGGTEKICDARGIKAANGVIAKGAEEMEPKAEETTTEVEQAPDANLKEGYYADGYIEPVAYSGATSFNDLEDERETQDTVVSLRRGIDDLTMLINNVMWDTRITAKLPALQGLFDEYLAVVQETLNEGPGDGEPGETEPTGDEMDNGELGETDAVDLSEQSALISVTEATIEDLEPFNALLAEQHVELTDPRRAPVLVNFAIIQPGHGNTRDKNYYPAETLSAAGPLFEGVDIFVTDHDADEKKENTKVGRFRTAGVLSEAGLCSQAIIYDPGVAEKTRNRADAGELGTLHCSIYATGTGKAGTVDDQEVTVIESITAVHSVDLVSRAGAGGRAISLAETDGGNMSKETKNENETEDLEAQDVEAQEVEAVEVAIVESDAAPEEAPAAEVEQPASVETARVIELLAESDLDGSAHKWVLAQTYEDETGVGRAIEEMRTFIADMTPAGQPFALGESAVATTADVPKVLTAEELEDRARKRTRTVMNEIDPTYAVNL